MAISGTGARIFFSTSTGASGSAIMDEMGQWTLSVDSGQIETNAFGSTWRTSIPGLRGAQGSAQGFWAVSDSSKQAAAQAHILTGKKGHVQLYTVAGSNEGYEGDAWITSLQIGAQVDAAQSFQVDFTIDGALSYSTGLTV